MKKLTLLGISASALSFTFTSTIAFARNDFKISDVVQLVPQAECVEVRLSTAEMSSQKLNLIWSTTVSGPAVSSSEQAEHTLKRFSHGFFATENFDFHLNGLEGSTPDALKGNFTYDRLFAVSSNDDEQSKLLGRAIIIRDFHSLIEFEKVGSLPNTTFSSIVFAIGEFSDASANGGKIECEQLRLNSLSDFTLEKEKCYWIDGSLQNVITVGNKRLPLCW